MNDPQHDFAIAVRLYECGGIKEIVTGNVSPVSDPSGTTTLADQEENAVRLAVQMVRELFRRRRRQLGQPF